MIERVEGVRYFELGDFTDLVGEAFVLSHPRSDQTFEGELIAAKPIKSDTGIDREPFCLDFRFPAGSNIRQETFALKFEKLDEPVELHLIPYAGDETGWYMTTQFN